MSRTSFLSSARKGGANQSSRVLKELANKIQKLYTANVVIQEEGLLDTGRLSKGRVLLQDRLRYASQITTIPNAYVPIEPDADKLTFWIKGNHTGLYLQDLSTFDNVITCKYDKHLCVVDSGGLDMGYLGTFNGTASSPCWKLNGVNEAAEVTDNTRIQVKATTIGFSVTAWVKISDFTQHNGSNRRILAKKDDASNAYSLFVTSSNKAVWAVKFNGTEYKVETPATLQEDTWYFIAATFKSTATVEARIYLNAVVSTTAFASAVIYPEVNTKMQLFTNGDTHEGDEGDFAGYVRDIENMAGILLTATDISRFNTNRNSISNIAFGQVTIAGFSFVPDDMALSSYTSTSYSTTSFNT